MTQYPLIDEYLGLNSIKLGEVYVKPRKQIESVLADYVGPLTVEFEGHVGLIGSYLKVRHGGEKFAVCTAHQVAVRSIFSEPTKNLEMLRFANLNTGRTLRNLPIDAVVQVASDQDSEIADALLFHVQSQNYANQLSISGCYFSLAPFDTRKRLASWAVGYPLRLNSLEQEPLIGTFVAQMIECEFVEHFWSHAAHLRRYVTTSESSVDMNGYSGGAVFSLVRDKSNFEFVLDGLIVRGGSGSVYVIDSGFLASASKRYNPAKVGPQTPT